jgi:hypothetical protein
MIPPFATILSTIGAIPLCVEDFCSIRLRYRRGPTFYGVAKGAGSRKRRRTFRVRRAMLLSYPLCARLPT